MAGIVAGPIFLLFQWGYGYVQRWMTSYNAIYGSFAALPLLLIWMQTSWEILLFGGELSFAYQNIARFGEERTSLAIVVTGAGLVAIVAFGFWLIPLWGYYGAAWARLASETVMVAVSWWLNRRYYPTPYDWRRIGEYVAAALAVFAVCEALTASADNMFVSYAFNIVLFALYAAYLVRRERIDLGAMLRAFLHR